MARRVTVVNQFAAPHGVVGPTRNVDIFSRTPRWAPHFIGANFAHHAKERLSTDDPRFTLVWVPTYTRNDIRRLLGWFVYSAQATVVAALRPAEVVYGSSPHLLNPVCALVAARLRGRPYVCEVRDLWPDSLVSAGGVAEGSTVHKILVRLEKGLYNQAERVVTVVDWSPHFRDLGLDPTGLLEVIPNGTEPDDFHVEEDREELRREFGIHGTTAVFTGSHGHKDGIDLIVNAAERCPEVNFLLVGEGGDKQANVEEAARRGLTNIEFRDPIPKSQIPRLLAACDIGLHVVAPIPVFDKGMSPTKLFDYMAMGMPVVTNARTPLSRVIADDEIGAVTDPDDIASGVRRVAAADEETRRRWREREAELMASTYSRTAAGRRMAEVLDEVVEEWDGGRSRTRAGRLHHRLDRVTGQVRDGASQAVRAVATLPQRMGGLTARRSH